MKLISHIRKNLIFENVGMNSNADIDECSSGDNKCASEQTCENTPGSYNCVTKRPPSRGESRFRGVLKHLSSRTGSFETFIQ